MVCVAAFLSAAAMPSVARADFITMLSQKYSILGSGWFSCGYVQSTSYSFTSYHALSYENYEVTSCLHYGNGIYRGAYQIGALLREASRQLTRLYMPITSWTTGSDAYAYVGAPTALSLLPRANWMQLGLQLGQCSGPGRREGATSDDACVGTRYVFSAGDRPRCRCH